jgi:hypothetical protein
MKRELPKSKNKCAYIRTKNFAVYDHDDFYQRNSSRCVNVSDIITIINCEELLQELFTVK